MWEENPEMEEVIDELDKYADYEPPVYEDLTQETGEIEFGDLGFGNDYGANGQRRNRDRIRQTDFQG